MKRIALLIGNSCGKEIEQGVKNDLNNYKSFLMSEKGGGYENHEIRTLFNQPINVINAVIAQIRKNRYDVAFTVFTGHGEYDNRKYERLLYIDKDTTIHERLLCDLAPKQILIIDSCAKLKYTNLSTTIMEVKAAAFSSSANINEYRKEYNRRCTAVPNQMLKLYSCSIDEYSRDADGGVYSTALLKTLSNSKDINIVLAHIDAAPSVKLRTNGTQNPSQDIPRLMSGQFLPGAISL